MNGGSHKNTWDIYTTSWSETDVAKRLKLFERCLSPDCVYTDPLTQATGYGPLSEYVSGLQRSVPGVRFVTTDFKTHHDQSLAHWNMVDAKGRTLVQGASHGRYDVDGRLKTMTGFFEPPKAG